PGEGSDGIDADASAPPALRQRDVDAGVAIHRLGLFRVLDEARELPARFNDVADLLRGRVERVVEALVGIAPPPQHLRIAEERGQPLAVLWTHGAQANALSHQHLL